MAQPTRDLLAERQALAAQRRTEEASIRATLQDYPLPVQAQFDFLLRAAQAGSQLKEDHGYWIDYKASYAMRRVLLAIGERLTTLGSLTVADDIFYLTLAEVKAVLTAQVEGQASGLAYPEKIDERKALAAKFANATPPPMLGTLPEGEPPNDPVSRMFLKMEGEIPTSPPIKHELRGNAGSAGVARGIVKVLRQIKDSAKLQPGDVLVAESTAPPWTPFFANIAAIVTNNGGVLSHTAVVAREYGIPAVVGTQVATLHLCDGQLVEVDGTLGIVRIQ